MQFSVCLIHISSSSILNQIQFINYCTMYGPYASLAVKDMIFNARQTWFLHEKFKSFTSFKTDQYIISIHLLSITNDLHCPSIKHSPYITYHQCIIFSDHLQYTTQLILKAVFWQFLIGSHNIWALRFIYFLYKIWCQSEVLRYEFKSFKSFKTTIMFCQFNPLG